MWWIALASFFVFTASVATTEQARSLHLGVGQSETVRVSDVTRVAVANGKVAKVKAIPPHTLLITGTRLGATTVRAWNHKNREFVFDVAVMESDVLEGDSDFPRVVKISLEFLELNESASRNLGIRWPESIQFSGDLTYHGSPASSGLNTTGGFSSARGFIHSLLHEGNAKMLAHPDLYVRVGEEAVFHSGGEFPITTVSDNYGRVYRQVQWKNYGLKVKVRPKSSDFVHISSDIHVEVSEPNPAQAVDGIPGLTKREVRTKMHSVDGETVVLSGLVREASAGTREGVPGFSSLPIIGPILFAATKRAQDQTEILIAVTFTMKTQANVRENLERLRKPHESRISSTTVSGTR